MKKLLLKISGFVLLVLLLITSVFILPFDKRFGREYVKQDCYNHAIWIYDRIHSNNKPIDIAFLGSSKTIHAINEPYLEQLLDSVTNKKTNIANFGYCRLGRNMEYENLLELLETKHPEKVVVEVREEEDRFSHAEYGYITDFQHVAHFIFYNPDYFSDLWKAYTVRLEYLKARLGLINFDTIPFQHDNYGFGDDTTTMDTNYAYTHIHKNTYLAVGNPSLHYFYFHFAEYYLQRIKELAAEHNIKLYFLYLPSYSVKIISPIEAGLYKSLGTLLIPPAQMFMNRKNFKDENHLNTRGSKVFCRWLSSQLAN